MEGNYCFVWKSVAATGEVEGEYSQVIYGETAAKALEYFVQHHGGLEPDENGVCNVITCLAWSPL